MKMPFSFIKNRFYFYAFSGLLFAAAILSIIFFKFNLGIDFAGGAIMDIRFDKSVTQTQITNTLNGAGFSYFTIQPTQGDYFIRTKNLDEAEHTKIKDALN